MPESTENVGLSAPWVVFARKAEALFERDPEVVVDLDNDGPRLTLYVDNPAKAEALALVVGASHEFGNVTMGIDVVPSNDEQTPGQVIRHAFEGNPALADVIETQARGGTDTYALFAPEVAQYVCDNAASPFGIETATYEQLARDVLDVAAFVSTYPKEADE